MRFVRSFAVGALAVGAATAMGLAGAGSASAMGVSPLPGGVQVDLNHDETMWAQQHNVGGSIASIPNETAQSFGDTFGAATEVSSTYPQGRVTFTAYGPINELSGLIVVFKE